MVRVASLSFGKRFAIDLSEQSIFVVCALYLSCFGGSAAESTGLDVAAAAVEWTVL